MPELPFPPDLDQLRRQARELLRAAAHGDLAALGRLHAASDRVTLSAAQLAVAREYGFRSWPALKAEVDRDRAIDLGAKPPPPAAVSPDLLEPPEERRLFGGAAAIETAGGVLSPELLVAGPGRAVLHASLVPSASATPPPPTAPRKRPLTQKERLAETERRTRQIRQWTAAFEDITVTDSRGTACALRVDGINGSRGQPDDEPAPIGVIFRLEPPPAREAAWVELRGHNGSIGRLVSSPLPAAYISQVAPVQAAANDLEDLARWLIGARLAGSSVGLRDRSIALARASAMRESGELDAASELPDQLARLCASLAGERPADDLPRAWSGMLSATNRSDGPACHLDIAAELPPLYGIAIQLDSLVSRPGGWKLYLRARPEWSIYSEDGTQKWDPISVNADDDLGGGYASFFGGSTGHSDLALRFLPRLNPLARRLRLRFRAAGEQVIVAFDLPSDDRAS